MVNIAQYWRPAQIDFLFHRTFVAYKFMHTLQAVITVATGSQMLPWQSVTRYI